MERVPRFSMRRVVTVGFIMTFSGLIIFMVSGLVMSSYSDYSFKPTTCKIIGYPPLANQTCFWAEPNELSLNYTYICSAATWKIEYATSSSKSSCLNPTTTVLNGEFQMKLGNNATTDSMNAALNDQLSREIGSEFKCYYHRKKCPNVKLKIRNMTKYYMMMFIGFIIFMFGFILALLGDDIIKKYRKISWCESICYKSVTNYVEYTNMSNPVQ